MKRPKIQLKKKTPDRSNLKFNKDASGKYQSEPIIVVLELLDNTDIKITAVSAESVNPEMYSVDMSLHEETKDTKTLKGNISFRHEPELEVSINPFLKFINPDTGNENTVRLHKTTDKDQLRWIPEVGVSLSMKATGKTSKIYLSNEEKSTLRSLAAKLDKFGGEISFDDLIEKLNLSDDE